MYLPIIMYLGIQEFNFDSCHHKKNVIFIICKNISFYIFFYYFVSILHPLHTQSPFCRSSCISLKLSRHIVIKILCVGHQLYLVTDTPIFQILPHYLQLAPGVQNYRFGAYYGLLVIEITSLAMITKHMPGAGDSRLFSQLCNSWQFYSQ